MATSVAEKRKQALLAVAAGARPQGVEPARAACDLWLEELAEGDPARARRVRSRLERLLQLLSAPDREGPP